MRFGWLRDVQGDHASTTLAVKLHEVPILPPSHLVPASRSARAAPQHRSTVLGQHIP
jgi:hypothetical protein